MPLFLQFKHTNNNYKTMFDYKYTVKSNDGYEWGLFKTRAQAGLMRNALTQNFKDETFWVEEVK